MSQQESYEEMLVEFSDTDGEYEPMEKKEVVLESSSKASKGKKYTVSEKAKKAKCCFSKNGGVSERSGLFHQDHVCPAMG